MHMTSHKVHGIMATSDMSTLPVEIFAIYFSAYSAHAIEYKGSVYPTVEHAYHCQRYVDQDIVAEIQNARSPYRAWEISQTYKQRQLQNFSDRKREVMKALCRTKFEQHEDVRRALLESRDSIIVKHITTGPKADGFWDDGTDGRGRNEVGKIWMEIRDELHGESK